MQVSDESTSQYLNSLGVLHGSKRKVAVRKVQVEELIRNEIIPIEPSNPKEKTP